MKFELIDYSQTSCENTGKTGGKFVQIRNDICEYIILSSFKRSKYHANIVELFCTQKLNIEIEYNSAFDKCYITDDNWKIIGGGFWKTEKNNITLYGRSIAYGRFNFYEKLCENIRTNTEYKTVNIE